MIKRIQLCLVMILGCTMFCGCSKEHKEIPKNTESMEAAWEDNDQDRYCALFHCNMTPSDLEAGFSYGGRNLMLTKTKAYILQKHLCMEDYRQGWDELIIADDNGKVEHVKLSLSFTPENNNQIVRMGPVAGTDHLLCVNSEGESDSVQWRVFELDEKLTPQWDFVAEFLDEPENIYPEMVISDEEGKIHLEFRSLQEGILTHYVVDQEGELLDSYHLEEMLDPTCISHEWILTENDKLLLKCSSSERMKDKDEIYYGTSSEGLGERVLTREANAQASQGFSYVLKSENPISHGAEGITYANKTGLYQSSAFFQNDTLLYAWENHGVAIQNLYALRSMGEARIGVLYQENEELWFTLLSPSAGPVERTEIYLAIPEYRLGHYTPFVNAFNKKYPAYQVKITTSYDEEARLLTELGTGSGPVLIDAYLTNFKEQKELWEPLDDLLTSAGLDDLLFEGAMEFCKIDGVTYAVATDFMLDTTYTREEIAKEDWDYEGFLRRSEDPELELPYTNGANSFSPYTFIVGFLMHGLEDNYIIDIESHGNYVNRERLERALDLAEKYNDNSDASTENWKELFQEGKVLSRLVAFRSVNDFYGIRLWTSREFYVTGYPTSSGGKHYISAVFPITIRNTASEKEKEVAKAFLLEVLSYDSQMAAVKQDYNYGISIRKDVFEAQMQWDMDHCYKTYGFVPVVEVMKEDSVMLRKLLEEAEPLQHLPEELRDIWSEELEAYFSGDQTRDQLYDHLEMRTRLYVNENK
ncbi:MAG: carbohydrate ABC transporter substrate-binding protein [Lachnospiraceae bacterium]|nr:carbohydrate ABC transporter substrate-binding protein [Lachnospiraceae bacterium]MBR6152586.1 carbohydrate ABC transporter substrate-binding protein [Lachnospiraceae bacterium]